MLTRTYSHGFLPKEEDILSADLYTPVVRVFLRVVYIPTVHLSIPEHLYKELKGRAEELGIQVTDLIKVYIMFGLKGELALSSERYEGDSLDELDSRLMYVEGRLTQIMKLLESLISKVTELEERVEELESPDIMPEVVSTRRKG